MTAEPAEISLSVTTNLRIDLDFGEDYIATLPIAEKFDYVVSSYAKFKWLWSNKDKLQALVERLRRYIENRINLTEDSLSDATCMSFYILGLSPDKDANLWRNSRIQFG